jgi:hypothetical protein
MSTISETGLKTEVDPVIELVSGTDSIVPAVLALQFHLKWDGVKTGQTKIKYATVLFIGIKVHAADPESPAIPE